MNLLRSVGAFFGGFLASVVPTLATDWALHATGVFPPLGQPSPDSSLILATIYRTVYGVAGAHIAARLAPGRPMGHALALGIGGLIASTAGAIATWNGGPKFGAKWYPLALIVLALPTAWAGGRLFTGSK